MSRLITNSATKIFFGIAPFLLSMPGVLAQPDLGDLSLEQLLSIEVTSASRKLQTLNDVAAAIFVISAEDIRRSGVTSIPEALRLAPGIHVSRIDDNTWAVSSRGFNDQYSNKLLVMMDGRPIYTPYFAGVYWDQHALSIDNIERIEVIRGPGATLWGSNAVNGVINIISRNARDTQGFFAQASTGERDSHTLAARYGSVTEGGWYYRVNYNAVEENITDSPLDAGNDDFWQHHQTSFRIDANPLADHELRLEGSYYQGRSKQIVNLLQAPQSRAELAIADSRLNMHGGWLMLDWAKQDESGEGWRIKSYIDRSARDFNYGEMDQKSASLEFQSRHLIGDQHDVIWGLGKRMLDLPFESRGMNFMVLDSNEDFDLVEFFIQDEISLNDRLSLTIGSKFEDSEYVDLVIQPSARINWQPSEGFSVWGSVSRAARTPSLGERQIGTKPNLILGAVPVPGQASVPITLNAVGDKGFESEWLTAYEAGIRGNLTESLGFDLSVFEFDYKDLRGSDSARFVCLPGNQDFSLDPACIASANQLATEITIANAKAGSSRGVELVLQWQASGRWRFSGAFSWFDYDLEEVPSINFEHNYNEPAWIGHLRGQWTLNDSMNLDFTIRGVDESSIHNIDSYVTADLRFDWRPNSEWTVELIGQNLIDDGHREYGTFSLEALPSHVRRNVMARITWAP